MSQGAGEEYVLRDKTLACKRLFESCLLNIPALDEDDWLEQKCAEFNWWSSGLNADKRGPGSLDSRLQLRQDIRDVVANVLNALETALMECQEIASSVSISKGQPPGASDADDGASEPDTETERPLSPWSNMADSSDSDIARGNDDSGLKLNPYHKQRFYIQINLETLIRIHNTIKRFGLKLRNKRADDDLKNAEAVFQHHQDTFGYYETLYEQDPLIGEHERFRRFLTKRVLENVYTRSLIQRLDPICDGRVEEDGPDVLLQRKLEIVIRAYYYDPARLSPVQRRLIDVNVVRRNRLLHARRTLRQQPHQDPPSAPERESMAIPKSLAPENIQNSPADASPAPQTPFISKSQHGKSNSRKSFVTRTATALEPNFSISGALHPPRSTRSAATKMSARVATIDYPKCPAKNGHFPCPYCPLTLSNEYTEKPKWRAHVAQDLCAYVCVHEDCETPDDMYTSSYEWMSHMAKCHSTVEWICPKCPSDGADVSAIPFHDPTNLKKHILDMHLDVEPSEIDLLINSSKRYPEIQRVKCPLCPPGRITCGTGEDEEHENSIAPGVWCQDVGLVQPEDYEHIATHIHEFSLQSIWWQDEVNPGESLDLSSHSTRPEITFQALDLKGNSIVLYNRSDIVDMIDDASMELSRLVRNNIDRRNTISELCAAFRPAKNDFLASEPFDYEELLVVLNNSRVAISELHATSLDSGAEGCADTSKLFEELRRHLKKLQSFFSKPHLTNTVGITDSLEFVPYFVVSIDLEAVIIPAGRAHGIVKGSEFAPRSPTSYGTFSVDEVFDFTSKATLTPEWINIIRIHNCVVIQTRWGLGTEVLRVLVDPVLDDTFQQEFVRQLQSEIFSRLKVAEFNGGPLGYNDLRLEKQGDSGINVWGPSTLVEYDGPVRGLDIQDSNVEDLAAKSAIAVTHLARFRHILDLKNIQQEKSAPFRVCLGDSLTQEVLSTNSYPDRQQLQYSFENTEGNEDLFFTTLNLGPGFDIRKICPPTSFSARVSPGGKRIFTFRMSVPGRLKGIQSVDNSVTHRYIIRTIVCKDGSASWRSVELLPVWHIKNITQDLRGIERDAEVVDSTWWVDDRVVFTHSE